VGFAGSYHARYSVKARTGRAKKAGKHHKHHSVQLGPRPYYLVEAMEDSELKSALQECADGPFEVSDFSIGHRGACLQFPEHTKESYDAAARMGAGIIECDVTFTADRELVCRHSQCDLHTTTDILAIPELATLERSGLLVNGGGYYYQSITDVTDNDGDTFEVLDVLAKDVGVIGIFSDWPATVTYYANCMGL
jgi:hypothetical protein